MPTRELQKLVDSLHPFMQRYAMVIQNNNPPIATVDNTGHLEFHEQSPVDISDTLADVVEAYVEFQESLKPNKVPITEA